MISSPNSINTREIITNVDSNNIFPSEESKQGFSSELSKLMQDFDIVNEKEKDLETYLTKHNNQDNPTKSGDNEYITIVSGGNERKEYTTGGIIKTSGSDEPTIKQIITSSEIDANGIMTLITTVITTDKNGETITTKKITKKDPSGREIESKSEVFVCEELIGEPEEFVNTIMEDDEEGEEEFITTIIEDGKIITTTTTAGIN